MAPALGAVLGTSRISDSPLHGHPTVSVREPARTAVARPQRYGSRSGTSRAVGAPSAALERAASWERGYVVKDFRRIAIVIVIALALLVASGVILNFFER